LQRLGHVSGSKTIKNSEDMVTTAQEVYLNNT